MLSRITRLFKSANVRNIALLSSGNVIGMGIAFLAQPIITRIYTPEQMGINTLVFALVTMFGTVINGKYDMCIVLAGDDRESDAVAVGGLLVSLLLSLVIGLGLLGLLLVKSELLGAGWWTLTAVPFLLLMGLTNVLMSYNNRYQQYRLLASVTVIRQIASSVGQIGFGLLQWGAPGLLLAQFISACLGVRQQARYALQNLSRVLAVTRREVAATLKANYRQPLFNATAVFVAAFAYSITNYLVHGLYGLKEVGFFALSFTLLGLPTTIISNNAQKVFFQTAGAERRETGQFRTAYRETARFMLVMAVPIFLVIMLAAPSLVSLIYGARWARAGEYIALLCPFFGLRFVVTVLMSALIIGKRQHWQLILQIGLIVETFVVYALASVWHWPIDRFLSVLNWVYFGHYLLLFGITYLASREQVPVAGAGAPASELVAEAAQG